MLEIHVLDVEIQKDMFAIGLVQFVLLNQDKSQMLKIMV